MRLDGKKASKWFIHKHTHARITLKIQFSRSEWVFHASFEQFLLNAKWKCQNRRKIIFLAEFSRQTLLQWATKTNHTHRTTQYLRENAYAFRSSLFFSLYLAHRLVKCWKIQGNECRAIWISHWNANYSKSNTRRPIFFLFCRLSQSFL